MKLLRSATFVKLEKPQLARSLMKALGRLWNFDHAYQKKKVISDSDTESDSEVEYQGQRVVEFDDDDDDLFYPDREYQAPANSDENLNSNGGVAYNLDEDDEQEVYVDQDDHSEDDVFEGGHVVEDVEDLYESNFAGIVEEASAGEVSAGEDATEAAPSETSSLSHSAPAAVSAPSVSLLGPMHVPYRDINPNYGPARAAPPGRQLIYDASTTFECSAFRDHRGLIEDNIRVVERQYGHRILTKHDKEFWSEGMNRARIAEWQTFEDMELLDYSAGFRHKRDLIRAGKICVGNVGVCSIKDEGTPQERYKYRLTADGGPLRGPTKKPVVPLTHP